MNLPTKIFPIIALFCALLAHEAAAQHPAPRMSAGIELKGLRVFHHDSVRNRYIVHLITDFGAEKDAVEFLDTGGDLLSRFELERLPGFVRNSAGGYSSTVAFDSRGNAWIAYSPDRAQLVVARISENGARIVDSAAVPREIFHAHEGDPVELDDSTLFDEDAPLWPRLSLEGEPLLTIDSADNLWVAFSCEITRDDIPREQRLSGDWGLHRETSGVVLRRYSPDGTLIWTRTYEVPVEHRPEFLDFGPHGIVALTTQFFSSRRGNATLFRIDGADGRLRSRIRSTEGRGRYEDLALPIFTSNGSIGLLGRVEILGEDRRETWMTEFVLFDSAGTIVKQHRWPDSAKSIEYDLSPTIRSGFHLLLTETDSAAVENRVRLMKIDGRGEILGEIPLRIDATAPRSESWDEGPSGEFYFASLDERGVTLSRVEPDGSLTWSHTYEVRAGNGKPFRGVHGIERLPGGGFLLLMSVEGNQYVFRFSE